MKHIQKFDDYLIKEEFLGGLFNFFKNLWKKAAIEIQKMEDDPNKIKEYIISNTLNIKSSNSVFKNELDKFITDNKDKNEDCFALIDSILNKETGALGKQGIGLLFNDKTLQGDKMKVKRLSFEYIINSARDQVIKKLKYDQKKNIESTDAGFTDKNYLSSFKEFLISLKDKKPEEKCLAVKQWVETNIAGDMINFVKAIKEDDIKAYVSKGGGQISGDYKVGDTVMYKRDGYNDALDKEQQKDKIGTKAIIKIDGDNYSFRDEKGIEFVKTKDKIISKVEDNDGDETTTDLKTKLGEIKDDKDKMATVDKFVDFLKNPANKEKIDDLLK